MSKASQGPTCVFVGHSCLLMDIQIHNANRLAAMCLPVNATERKHGLDVLQVAPLSCVQLCLERPFRCTHVHTVRVVFGSAGAAAGLLFLEYGRPFPLILSVFSQVFLPSLFCCPWDWVDLLDQARLEWVLWELTSIISLCQSMEGTE